MDITLREAICGFTKSIQHLSGKQIEISNNPPNDPILKPGSRKVIPKEGMFSKKGTDRGHMTIVFQIKFPDRLSREQITQIANILH